MGAEVDGCGRKAQANFRWSSGDGIEREKVGRSYDDAMRACIALSCLIENYSNR